MDLIIRLHDAVFTRLEAASGLILGSLGRLLFAAVLLNYFWASGLTKLGSGISGLVQPSLGAYAQIFPRAMEAVSYNIDRLRIWEYLVVLSGTYTEFLLPALILIGLATRLAALGMIGFIVVQSLTDIVGHGADAGTIGVWFDRVPDAVILDQRALWVFALLVLVVKGAGPISVDGLLRLRRVMDD